MRYHACIGCVNEGQPCAEREAVKERIRGLGVTSLKWRCKERRSRFTVGAPVWALTVSGHYDEEGQPSRGHYPGVVVRMVGAKALVFIPEGASGRDTGHEFRPNDKGFCKLPLSRLSARDAAREDVCRWCELPQSQGHLDGYPCAVEQ